MSRLLLLRHGQSTWNATDRWQGWSDAPLTAAGEQQARDAAARLGGIAFDAVVSSDLVRATRTAELVAEALGLGPIEVDARVRELDVGEWAGLTRPEIDDRYPGELERWRDGSLQEPPGGEPRPVFVSRITAGVEAWAKRYNGGSVVVVTHGGVIRSLHRAVGGEPQPVPNLGGLWFTWDGERLAAAEPVDLLALSTQ